MNKNIVIYQLVRVIIMGGLSALFAFIMSPLVLKFLKKHNMIKHIRKDSNAPIFTAMHQKKEGTPTMAGILIWGTVFLFAIVFWVLSFINPAYNFFNFVSRPETFLILGIMALAALVGMLDDLLGIYGIGPKGGGLSMKKRILIYILIGLIGAIWFFWKLEWDVVLVPFIGIMHLGWFYPLFFIFIFTACAFSMNETDGIDGLSAGVSMIGLLAYVIIVFIQGRYNVAVLLAVTLGALLAYLWHNIHPAEFFMGDTGVMTLGVLFGILAMYTNTPLFLPLLLLIPMLESMSVIIQLIYKKTHHGKKLFLSTPFHHHFEALGWPETKVTMRFWIIQGLGATLGVLLYLLNIMLIK